MISVLLTFYCAVSCLLTAIVIIRVLWVFGGDAEINASIVGITGQIEVVCYILAIILSARSMLSNSRKMLLLSFCIAVFGTVIISIGNKNSHFVEHEEFMALYVPLFVFLIQFGISIIYLLGRERASSSKNPRAWKNR